MSRAVIVGAGVAGLGAALRLGESGRWRPLLLERADRPGGLARSLHFKGVSSDLGPHRIHTEIKEVGELIERIAAPSLYTVQRRSHIYLKGRFLPYPPSAVAMARNFGILRLGRFGASYLAAKLRPGPAAETFESIMQGAFGRALYDYLLRPYIAKTWKTDPARLHADTARVRVSAGSLAKMVRGLLSRGQDDNPTALRQFRYVRGGAETLVRHLWEQARAHGAELRLETEVVALELDEGLNVSRARLRRASQGDTPALPTGADDSAEGEAFLSTVPLPVLLERLLPQRPELADARQAVQGLHYLNMIFVVLIVRRKVITGDNWLYFPEPELIFNRGYEAKSMDPGMAPADRSVICLEITLRPDDPRWHEGDGELLKLVTAQAAGTGLFAASEVAEGLVYRLPYAYPVYGLDYAERLDRTLAGLRRIPNLLTLGRQGLFNHNNMDHSIYMGLQAADRLNKLSLKQAVTEWYDSVGRFKRLRIVD